MKEREALAREDTMRTGDGEPLEEHGYLPEHRPAGSLRKLPSEQKLGENPDETELQP